MNCSSMVRWYAHPYYSFIERSLSFVYLHRGNYLAFINPDEGGT